MNAPVDRRVRRAMVTSAETRMVLVGWHQGQGGIVFFKPDGSPSSAWSASLLQREGMHPSGRGWTGTDADFRHCLPRIDPSPLSVGP